MFCRAFCVVLAVASLASVILLTEAAPSRKTVSPQDALLRFHPVSQAEYDRILKTTGVKQPMPFEVRHLQVSSRPLEQLRTISNDFSTGWHRLLNFAGFEKNGDGDNNNNNNDNNNDNDNDNDNDNENNDNKYDDQVKGYPLCMVKSSDIKAFMGDRKLAGRGYEAYGDVGLGGGDSDTDKNDNYNGRPVVNCVVVLRPKKKKPQQLPPGFDEDVGGKPPYVGDRPGYGPGYHHIYPHPNPYYPYYPMHPPAPEEDEEEEEPEEPEEPVEPEEPDQEQNPSKNKFQIIFGRNVESEPKSKSTKIHGKSNAIPKNEKAQSRQAYAPGYGFPLTVGYPQQSALLSGLSSEMSYPFSAYGQPSVLGQSSSSLYGGPGMFGSYGGYGYGPYDNDNEYDEDQDQYNYPDNHYDNDYESDNEDHYDNADYYDNDEHYNSEENYDNDNGYDNDHDNEDYRSLKSKKNTKKNA